MLLMAATFVEVYEVCSYFTSKNNEPRSNELLNGLIHNYGNRNILAASIAMKLPFIMYGFIVFKKGILKYGVLFLVFISSLSVLLIGARTAIFNSTILFVGILIYLFIKKKIN